MHSHKLFFFLHFLKCLPFQMKAVGLSRFYTQCDNSVLGRPQRVAGVLSQANSCIQARLNMFQHAFTRATDQMSRSFPSSRGSSSCAWCTVGGKMSVKNPDR
jgi:hypothetical protein